MPEQVTTPQKHTENAEFAIRRLSDLSHLASGPQSAIVQPSWSSNHEFKRRRGHLMCKKKGFSRIELLIVVAIILIIAAIAIPNRLRARIAANESSAVASIRTMNTAQISN